MKKLPDTFEKNGLNYKMVERNDKAVIYQQFNAENLPIGYEVFRVKIQKETDMVLNGVSVHLEEKEALPSNESFGLWAWGYDTLPMAIAKFMELSKDSKVEESVESTEESAEKSVETVEPKKSTGKRGRPPVKTSYNGVEYPSKRDAIIGLINLGMEKKAIADALKINYVRVCSVYKEVKGGDTNG
jgi:hypothetical protein